MEILCYNRSLGDISSEDARSNRRMNEITQRDLHYLHWLLNVGGR